MGLSDTYNTWWFLVLVMALAISLIIVYTFAELDNFKQFQRSILKVRPDADEFATFDIKADIPFIAVSVRRGDKNANFESLAANEVCRALLSKKGEIGRAHV